jgi:TM2 domain-containing membrane protein YozV
MQPQQVVHHHHHHAPPKSAGVAIALELGGGWFFQTFGIGHLYAGNIGLGLVFMFGYWFVTFINILLCFILIGAITWPLCWIAMMILSPILVANKVKEINVQALH